MQAFVERVWNEHACRHMHDKSVFMCDEIAWPCAAFHQELMQSLVSCRAGFPREKWCNVFPNIERIPFFIPSVSPAAATVFDAEAGGKEIEFRMISHRTCFLGSIEPSRYPPNMPCRPSPCLASLSPDGLCNNCWTVEPSLRTALCGDGVAGLEF